MSYLHYLCHLGAVEQLMDRENVGKLWGLNQHFTHIQPTSPPHFNNNIPIPTNCQLLINYFTMFAPKIPHYSTIYPLSPHLKINILSSNPHIVNAQVLWVG